MAAVVAILATPWLAAAALGDLLVLDDSLIGGTKGARTGCGGTFTAEGWRVDCQFDGIYWHLPYTIQKGAAEFHVNGLLPNECRVGMEDKSELFHMYDYTWGSADTNYGGYRDNPYKHFIRKIGCAGSYNNSTNAFEIVWKIEDEYQEPDSSVMGWDGDTDYVIREEWGPDGAGNTVLRVLRDGVEVRSVTLPGAYNPAGHSVRIGAIGRPAEDAGAPIGAVFHHLKVWDLTDTPPVAPEITYPTAGLTVNTTEPVVRWIGDIHSKYQMRVTAANDPNSNIVWDSGNVTFSQGFGETGSLPNAADYYVFVRTWNCAGWSGWSEGRPFRVDTAYQLPNTGITSISGNSIRDGNGPFLGLGATYMSALRKCRYYRDRFENDLAYLASRGFNFVRILTMVSWQGKEIAPIEFQSPHGNIVEEWSDYWSQFRDCLDLVHKYGMRTEITIFADAQHCMPDLADRYAHMDRVLQNIAGREHKVIMIEVANEHWQNGVPLDMCRTFGKYLADRTSIPVALSAPFDSSDEGICQMYCDSAADVATVHFTRDQAEDGWLPVRDSWRSIPGVPPLWSNEPIGPGSSVSSENDPIKLVSAACFAWIANLPGYVYHTRSGVYGGFHFYDMAGSSDFVHLLDILPGDLASWTRNDGKEPSAPFTAYCGGQANRYWTDVPGATSGCHRNIGGTKGKRFVCYPQGILSGGVSLKARKQMSITVYNPLTGVAVDTRELDVGEDLVLEQGPRAYIIKGLFTGPDTESPGPVMKFAANPAEGHNVLTWRNPSDSDFWGVRIVYRTDRYPEAHDDGVLVRDGVGAASASEQFTHSGLANGTRYYYAAFAYDDATTPNYSGPALVMAAPVSGQCFSERFTYPNGELAGNRSWEGSAHFQVLSDAVKISGGPDNVTVVHPATCSGSVIEAHIRVKAGSGTSTLWGFWVDDANGNNLARWYGSGTTARPRIAGTHLVLEPIQLTGGWDDLAVRINTAANTTDFYANGAFLGTLSHASTGAGDSAARVVLERVYGGSDDEYVELDSLVIGPSALDITAPGPVTSFAAFDQESRVDLSWSNPGDADFAAARILYKTTGYPTDASDGVLLYDGTATNCVHADPAGGTTYYAAYAYDSSMNFSTAATASITRASQPCHVEDFPYPDGNLNGNGGWTGSATSQITLGGQAVRISGGSGACDASHTVSCTGGPLGVRLKMKKGSGAATIWNLWVCDSSGGDLGRWLGTGSSARGRVGMSTPTGVGSFTGGWDDLYAIVDFAANTTRFVFNGTVLGTVSHTGGDSLGWIRVERADSPTAGSQFVYLDDLAVESADVLPPSASIGAPSASVVRAGTVSYAVSFSEPVFGLNAASDVQVNSTGSASAGAVTVTGSGAGPYTITLSGLTGDGTLGITIKAGACTDAAGNANTAGEPGTAFALLSADGSIAAAKRADNQSAVALGNKALYFRSSGFGYIEEPDRSCGVRVEGDIYAGEGDLVCLTGTMDTTSYGERLIRLGGIAAAGSGPVKPLGMNSSALQAGAALGLYARVWGVVKAGSVTGASYVLLGADGSEVKVYTRGTPTVHDGDFAVVSGAVGIEDGRVIHER